MNNQSKLLRQVRRLLVVFVVGLIISGVSAFPIQTGLRLIHEAILSHQLSNTFTQWLETVYLGVEHTYSKYPFIAYGTDWLAFAHIVLAILFAGIIRDPLRNIWVIEFGLIACVAIFPLALIAGPIRGIPFFWQLLDCSFGIAGGAVLWICHRKVKRLSSFAHANMSVQN